MNSCRVFYMRAGLRSVCSAARTSTAFVRTASRRACTRAFSAAPAAGEGADVPKIVRFIAEDGVEYYGAFTDVTESSCRIAKRNAAGKMTLSEDVKVIDIILPPVDPPAIYCVGLNYADHAAEVKLDTPKYPVLFMKAVTALTGHNSAIVIPRVAQEPPEVDYEAELAVVIGKEGMNIPEDRAMEYVMGYTIINDVTARRWQGKRGGGQWIRSKSFDTFCPCGPHITPKSHIPDPHNLKIRTVVNGEIVQDSNTSNMIFTIPQLIAFISQGTTLLPGTIISSGTPAGVGFVKDKYLKRGDTVSITIDGIGTLLNHVGEEIEMGMTEL